MTLAAWICRPRTPCAAAGGQGVLSCPQQTALAVATACASGRLRQIHRHAHRFAQAVLNLPFPFDDSVKAPRLSQECSSRGNGGDTDVAKESSSTNISPILGGMDFIYAFHPTKCIAEGHLHAWRQHVSHLSEHALSEYLMRSTE